MKIEFKQDAKQIVDSLFDAKVFQEKITRDDMNSIEGLICYLMKTRVENYQRAQKLFESINNKK